MLEGCLWEVGVAATLGLGLLVVGVGATLVCLWEVAVTTTLALCLWVVEVAEVDL